MFNDTTLEQYNLNPDNAAIIKDAFNVLQRYGTGEDDAGSESNISELIENFLVTNNNYTLSVGERLWARSLKSAIQLYSPRYASLYKAQHFQFDETIKNINTRIDDLHTQANTTNNTDNGISEGTINTTVTNENKTISEDTHSDNNKTNADNESTVTDNTTKKSLTAADVSVSGQPGFDSDGTMLDTKNVDTGSNVTNGNTDTTVTGGGTTNGTTDDNGSSKTGVTNTQDGGNTESVVQTGQSNTGTVTNEIEGLNILKSDAYDKFNSSIANLNLDFLSSFNHLFSQW